MLKKICTISFLLLIFSLPIVNIFNFPIFNQKILLTDILFLLTFALFFIAFFLKKITIKFSKFYIPLVFYLVAFFISTVFSSDVNVSLVKFLGVIYLIGLAVLTFNFVSSIDITRRFCLIWLTGTMFAALVSCITIFIFYFDRTNTFLKYTLSIYGTLPPGNYPRVQSTFLNPNMFCHFLNISFLILFVSYHLKWIKSFVFYALLIAFSIAAFFTLSPGIGGVWLGIGLWLWVFYKEKQKPLYAKFSLFCGVFSAILFFATTVFTIDFTNLQNSILGLNFQPSARFMTWQSAFQIFLQNPLAGQGLATNAANVFYIAPDGGGQFLTDAHQMWLNVAAQAGILGLAAISFLGFYLLKCGLTFNFNDKKNTIKTGLCIAFLTSFFYQGLTGSYEDARHLWVLIGFIGAVIEEEFSADS